MHWRAWRHHASMTQWQIWYGSTTGRGATIAEQVAELLDQAPEASTDIAHHSGQSSPVPAILITATWNNGEQQLDWQRFLARDGARHFRGVRCGLIGLGDQIGYPATYQSALFELASKLEAAGAQLIGQTGAEGHRHTNPLITAADGFPGLALDQETQDTRTPGRLRDWLATITPE